MTYGVVKTNPVTVPRTAGVSIKQAVLTLQEYILAHTEMPTTLEGAEAAIKKQEDFMTTMDANEDKVNNVVEAGRRLANDGNINAERIQERISSIDDRSASVQTLERLILSIVTVRFGTEPEHLDGPPAG